MASLQEVLQLVVHSCSSGDYQTLQNLLSQYPDVDINMTTEGGATLLMHTIIGAGTGINPDGHYVDTCHLLLECGAERETVDLTNGRTAAHWAVYYHVDDILTELIISGSDMTSPDFTGTSPFHLAIQESATKCLQESLRFLPKEILEQPDAQGQLPLFQAIQLGNLEACQVLVATEADVNRPDEISGRTAVHFAVEQGNGQIVELLLRSGGLLDVVDDSGLTPIHKACIVETKESLDAIVRVVGSGEVLNLVDKQGMTPLMYACFYGNEETVKLLLKKKVKVQAQDLFEGKTALHFAAGSGYATAPGVVQLLCKKHRDQIEKKDSIGRRPLHLCAVSGLVESLQVLVTSGCDLTAVDDEQRTAAHWAAISGNPVVLTSLINFGSPSSSQDVNGATPLHYAAQEAREPSPLDAEAYTEEALAHSQNVLQCIGILIENGVATDCTDQQGMQPLHWAVQHPYNTQAITVLVNNYGADSNAKNNNGMTVLHVAAQHGVVENCLFLLEHTGGKHGNEVDNRGQTALHYAVQSGSADCLEYLLGCGLTIDQGDEDGQTASHLAATLGSLQALQLLQAYGASFSVKSVHGATPLHEAAANGHTDALEFLLTVAANQINVTAGVRGATPLHYAVASGHEGCVRVLIQHGANVNSLTTNEEGEKLAPLDFCSEEFEELKSLLKSCDALPGVEVAKQQEESEKLIVEEISEEKAEDQSIIDAVSIPSRPTTPTRPSQATPTFETEQPLDTSSPVERVTTPTKPSWTEDQRPALMKRKLSALKRSRSQLPQGSILSSTVGFYAANATMLAAAIIGTPLGDKMNEVAQKVATDTAEELKKEAVVMERDIPDLVWLREEVEPPRTPTPVVTKSPTPPPPTPPPPVPEIKEDPYDRRLRKARAQMDMSKSPGFLAVEELLKAQKTHTKLQRDFQKSMLEENLEERRECFAYNEMMEKDESAKMMKKLTDRMTKAEKKSQEMNAMIDKQLSDAQQENNKLSSLMSSMGINSRPTVAQWLQQKNNQKKMGAQEALIIWDRSKRKREEAILLQQAITSQRALKHAAWGARKELSSRIKSLKESSLGAETQRTNVFPSPKSHHKRQKLNISTLNKKKLKSQPTYQPRNSALSSKVKVAPSGCSSSVRATPVGFQKIRDTSTTVKTPPVTKGDEVIWKMGQRYIKGKCVTPLSMICPPSQAYLRATGPKTIHAERTLNFVSPEDYKTKKMRSLEKELSQQFGDGSGKKAPQRLRRRSNITVRSLDLETKKSTRKRSMSHDSTVPMTTHSGTMYHSLADSLGGGRNRLPRQQEGTVPVLPMTVIDPLSSPIATA